MAINLKLALEPPVDPDTDAWGRTWVGWDPRRSDEELWAQNRGVWPIRAGIEDDQRLATLSYDGVVRIVARLVGTEEVWDPSTGRQKRALVGDVLPPGNPVRDALVGTEVDRHRSPVTYTDTSAADDLSSEPESFLGGSTYLLTHNPDRWAWDPVDRAAAVHDTQAGMLVRGDWSTGNRTHVAPGDRIFLLQQGTGIRGVVASGHFSSRVFTGPHFTDPERTANYAMVEWDTVVDEADALPTADLIQRIPSLGWKPQGSGELLPEPAATQLEALWAAHTKRPTPQPHGVLGGGHAWLNDPARRKQAEDHAQKLLEDYYRSQGWMVVDTRARHPYDAMATKNGATLYLEAKGTQTTGGNVLVSRGEVDFARSHAGQCVIGVVSGIRFDPAGQLDVTSGRLRIFDWLPLDRELQPIQFQWAPSAAPIV